MRVFLDFEASSLSDDSYPIEVGWVFEDGRTEAHLIRPAPQWTDWDAEAEALHGISREALWAEGTPHDVVARRILEVLGPHTVYVSAPSWDGKWLSVLLRAAGLPRHAMRLKDTAEAHEAAAADALAAASPPNHLHAEVDEVLSDVVDALADQPPAHRALADAERERAVWMEVGRRAAQRAKRLRPD